MNRKPVDRDNAVRRKERDSYWPMVSKAMEFFAEELVAHPELPVFEITRRQADGYDPWKIPKDYDELCLRVVVKMVLDHKYELGPTQVHYAFVESAWCCRRLKIDGQTYNQKEPT